ncbi:MAG TPA: radical SAM protein [Phycisphaerae bacterium]|nr:radical SAM protein [Phycisphaerae bacterium]
MISESQAGTGRRKLRLINPRSPLSTITMPQIIRHMTFSRRGLFMPLNLAICAAVVPDGWDVEIIDENVTDGPHVPEATGIDAVGIGAMTTQATRAYALADAYRALGVPVILGGIHPSALPDEALQHGTIVCRGDAECTLPRALRDLDAARGQGNEPAAGQACPPKPRRRREPRRAEHGLPRRVYDWADDPDVPIATPRKDLLDPKQYLVFNPIQTTRGCPHNCTFCTTPAIFGRKYRKRAIGDIVEEMRLAKERFNTRVFIFSDDDVAGNHAWAMELFEAIRPLNVRWASQCDILISYNDKLLTAMRRSGCLGVILGLESPKADTLAEAGKRYVKPEQYVRQIRRIQSHRISIWGSFIFGFDSDDWHDCMNAVRFAERAKLCMSCYPILTPYPGTAVYEQYLAEGRLLTRDWDKYNGATVVHRPARMTIEELRHAQMAAFNEFYSPASSFRRLRIWPLKRNSWLANLAIHRGLRYYYGSKGRPLPRFSDYIDPDADGRIARSLGLKPRR